VLLLAIVALGVPSAINLSARVNAEVRTQAQGQADLVAATAADLLDHGHRIALTSLAQSAAGSVRGRVLIVNADGIVLADSPGPPQLGQSYESRPEIQAALAGRQVQAQRASKTLGRDILATAVPIIRNGNPKHPVGAVRITQSVAAVNAAVRRTELGLALIALIVLALGLAAGALIAAQVARPLRRLEAVAARVAQGDLNARAQVEGSTEQRSLARSFNEMTGRISRLLSAQRDFVADASHQLRTPLTGLRLRLEETKAVESSPEAIAELDAAIAEVDRLAHTVEELLVLSRAGERRSAAASVDVEDLAAAALQRWRPTAAGAGIALDHRRDGDGGQVWAARPDLERVLDTLLENAVQYSAPGTRVTIVTAPGRIHVCDRGPGIGQDERELVFGRFHRGRAGRAGPPGHGLGLAIARELAREWSADVGIEAREGGGTIATLSFAVDAQLQPDRPQRFARS
jgi:two-component system, OmpR family, sensor kinase